MKRRVALVVATLSLLMVTMVPAVSAHPLPPCNNGTVNVGSVAAGASGALYAKHHIAALAKVGGLGNDAHKPGSHMGFSLCNPSGK